MEKHADPLPRILIVDDQPDNLQVLGQELQGVGKYSIAFAQSGEEALELVERLLPDLILLDVMMPGINGFEVCERLKQEPRYRDIPVIFITAMSDVESMVEGFRAGGADYVTKPFQSAVLLARVETHLRLHLYHKHEEEMRNRERFVAYQNGMVEMGADILHNIGNAIVGMEGQVLGIRGVEKDLNMLGNGLDRAISYLEHDEKREKAEKILRLSSQILHSSLQEIVSGNGAALQQSIEQIRKIILSQRAMNYKGMQASPFLISTLLSDIYPLFGSELVQRKIAYQTDLQEELPEVVLPRSPLSQLMINLVKNSYEAIAEAIKQGVLSEGEGKITVRATASEGRWQLNVEDNGIGIKPELLDQVILSRFTTKPNHGGQGLHNAANLLHSLQGKLKVQSEGEGKGCSVQIRLPLSRQ